MPTGRVINEIELHGFFVFFFFVLPLDWPRFRVKCDEFFSTVNRGGVPLWGKQIVKITENNTVAPVRAFLTLFCRTTLIYHASALFINTKLITAPVTVCNTHGNRNV